MSDPTANEPTAPEREPAANSSRGFVRHERVTSCLSRARERNAMASDGSRAPRYSLPDHWPSSWASWTDLLEDAITDILRVPGESVAVGCEGRTRQVVRDRARLLDEVAALRRAIRRHERLEPPRDDLADSLRLVHELVGLRHYEDTLAAALERLRLVAVLAERSRLARRARAEDRATEDGEPPDEGVLRIVIDEERRAVFRFGSKVSRPLRPKAGLVAECVMSRRSRSVTRGGVILAAWPDGVRPKEAKAEAGRLVKEVRDALADVDLELHEAGRFGSVQLDARVVGTEVQRPGRAPGVPGK